MQGGVASFFLLQDAHWGLAGRLRATKPSCFSSALHLRRKASWLEQILGWGGGDADGASRRGASDTAFDPAGWWPEDPAGVGEGAAAGEPAAQQRYGGSPGAAYRSRRERGRYDSSSSSSQVLYAQRQVGDFGWRDEGEGGPPLVGRGRRRHRATPGELEGELEVLGLDDEGEGEGEGDSQGGAASQQERDIITGEVVGPPGGEVPKEEGGAAEPVDRDVITGEPVARDYRLQPVREVARWLGAAGEEGRR